MPISHGSSSESDAPQPDANGRSDALTVPLLDYPHTRGPPRGEPGAPHRSGIIRSMRGFGGAAARRGAPSTRPSCSTQLGPSATEPPRPAASMFHHQSVDLLFEPLYCFFAPFALHRGRPLLHSPGRFAAANLSGTASSTDARQPPGPQEPLLPAPGFSGAGGSEDGDVFTVS